MEAYCVDTSIAELPWARFCHPHRPLSSKAFVPYQHIQQMLSGTSNKSPKSSHHLLLASLSHSSPSDTTKNHSHTFLTRKNYTKRYGDRCVHSVYIDRYSVTAFHPLSPSHGTTIQTPMKIFGTPLTLLVRASNWRRIQILNDLSDCRKTPCGIIE